jgi:hypothetical protein
MLEESEVRNKSGKNASSSGVSREIRTNSAQVKWLVSRTCVCVTVCGGTRQQRLSGGSFLPALFLSGISLSPVLFFNFAASESMKVKGEKGNTA